MPENTLIIRRHCMQKQDSLRLRLLLFSLSLMRMSLSRHFPCPPCATLLANCGIRRLFFFEGYSLVAAQEILEGKGVEIIHVVL